MRENPFVTPNQSGALLKAARLERGETQAQAAQNMGISVSTLSRLERDGVSGRTRFLSVVLKVVTYYGISCDELLEHAMQAA